MISAEDFTVSSCSSDIMFTIQANSVIRNYHGPMSSDNYIITFVEITVAYLVAVYAAVIVGVLVLGAMIFFLIR